MWEKIKSWFGFGEKELASRSLEDMTTQELELHAAALADESERLREKRRQVKQLLDARREGSATVEGRVIDVTTGV